MYDRLLFLGFVIHILFFFIYCYFFYLQGLLTAGPQIIDLSAQPHMHSHSYGGHHHGIDMSHPGLALSTMLVSISVKEGYLSAKPLTLQYRLSYL